MKEVLPFILENNCCDTRILNPHPHHQHLVGPAVRKGQVEWWTIHQMSNPLLTGSATVHHPPSSNPNQLS